MRIQMYGMRIPDMDIVAQTLRVSLEWQLLVLIQKRHPLLASRSISHATQKKTLDFKTVKFSILNPMVSDLSILAHLL